MGRYPDGGSDVFLMDVPTIEQPNLASSYDQQLDEQALGVGRQLIASDGDLRMRCLGQTLFLASDEAQYARVDIFNGNGQQVESNAVNFHSGRSQLSIAHLPTGFYIARATDNHGNTVSCKVLR